MSKKKGFEKMRQEKLDLDTPEHRRIFNQNVGWICKHSIGPRCERGIVPSCYTRYTRCQFFEGEMRHPEMMGIEVKKDD